MTKSACEFVQTNIFLLHYLKIKFIQSSLISIIGQKLVILIYQEEADLIVIAPATANTLYKIANGVADDLVNTIMLASNKPTLIAPSMNVKMWENQNTVSNVLKLKEQGIHFIGPNKGKK